MASTTELLRDKLIEYAPIIAKMSISKVSHSFDQKLLQKKIDQYVRRSIHYNSRMKTIVFRNQEKTIWDLYIPATIKHKYTKETVKIEEKISFFLQKNTRVLITDSAGMGKSTISKYMFLEAVKARIAIPVLVELRKLNQKTGIFEFVLNEIGGIEDGPEMEAFKKLFDQGEFIFFLDGFDEISVENKATVTSGLVEFMRRYLNNRFFVTSRPENEISSLGVFEGYEVVPLEPEEAYNLIEKYDQKGEISKSLIKYLRKKEGRKDSLRTFLANPLMTTLLYEAFAFKQKLPFKKCIFYDQVFDALYESHDLTKEGGYVHSKVSGLDIDSFHAVMRCFGQVSGKTGAVEYTRSELLGLLTDVKKILVGVTFKEADLLQDLTKAVPMLIKEGDSYRWTHKSFQDYFFACYICRDSEDRKKKMFQKISRGNLITRFRNVLDFCFEMDYKTFRHTVLRELLLEYVNYFENAYFSFIGKIPMEDINIRKGFAFRREYICLDGEELDIRSENVVGECLKIIEKENIQISAGYEPNTLYAWTGKGRKQSKGIIFDRLTYVYGTAETSLIDFLGEHEEKIFYKKLKRSEKLLKFPSGTKAIKIDDNINNFFNTLENFKISTDYMDCGLSIDISLVKTLIEQINIEIHVSSIDPFEGM
jgi:energy-coupling factor transporter ATP-binding protein EcfA2